VISLGLVIILMLIVLWNSWQFYNILGRRSPTILDLGNRESVVILSDLHLKESLNEHSELLVALSRIDPSTIIIAGDLFENEHRKVDEDSLKKMLYTTLKSILWSKEIVYLVSSSSHDPIPSTDKICLEIAGTRIIVLRGALLHFRSNNVNFYTFHGDFLCRNGAYAGLLNLLASILFKRELFLEELGKKFLGLERKAWLIMGHTHIAGLDTYRRIINCGCWKSYWRAKATGTLVHVYRGTPKLLSVSYKESKL